MRDVVPVPLPLVELPLVAVSELPELPVCEPMLPEEPDVPDPLPLPDDDPVPP